MRARDDETKGECASLRAAGQVEELRQASVEDDFLE